MPAMGRPENIGRTIGIISEVVVYLVVIIVLGYLYQKDERNPPKRCCCGLCFGISTLIFGVAVTLTSLNAKQIWYVLKLLLAL